MMVEEQLLCTQIGIYDMIVIGHHIMHQQHFFSPSPTSDRAAASWPAHRFLSPYYSYVSDLLREVPSGEMEQKNAETRTPQFPFRNHAEKQRTYISTDNYRRVQLVYIRNAKGASPRSGINHPRSS